MDRERDGERIGEVKKGGWIVEEKMGCFSTSMRLLFVVRRRRRACVLLFLVAAEKPQP
jgi:hypothetical protein